MNGEVLGKMAKSRHLCKTRRTQTEKSDIEEPKLTNNRSQQKCDQFLQALRHISIKNKEMPINHRLKSLAVNLTIPMRENNSSSRAISTPEMRLIKQKDFFITKMRRKEETRTKLVLERLQGQDKSMSLLQLCEKLKQATQAQTSTKNRSQTIKDMLKKIRHRNQNSLSDLRSKRLRMASQTRESIHDKNKQIVSFF